MGKRSVRKKTWQNKQGKRKHICIARLCREKKTFIATREREKKKKCLRSRIVNVLLFLTKQMADKEKKKYPDVLSQWYITWIRTRVRLRERNRSTRGVNNITHCRAKNDKQLKIFLIRSFWIDTFLRIPLIQW